MESKSHYQGVYTSVDELIQLRFLAANLSIERNKKSTAIMDGASRSSFRGRGMEFAEVRPYYAGDDIRSIDWRVTARTQKPYTKLFQEEKERPVYLVIDQRSPMFFGTTSVFKSVYAARIASVIAWIACNNSDRIGALIFSDTDQFDIRAKQGRHAALAILHQLNTFNAKLSSPIPDPAQAEKHQSLSEMLKDARRVAKPGSAVFVISDFHDFDDECEKSLAILSRHTDTSLINLYDKLEAKLPPLANLSITNTRKKLIVSGKSSQLSKEFESNHTNRIQNLKNAVNRYGVPLISSEVSADLNQLVRGIFASKRGRK